jgi:hypothetical protein
MAAASVARARVRAIASGAAAIRIDSLDTGTSTRGPEAYGLGHEDVSVKGL